MGLFSKKFCDFCGDKIGLLGNRKLADGNMCKECASRMSSWLVDRRDYTVEEMKQHFAYREENLARLRNFKVSNVIGRDKYKLYIDLENSQWFITQYENYLDENPDVFDFSQVTNCDIDMRESRRELRFTHDGHSESYNPPEFDYDYDFYMVVYLNGFLVPDLRFKLNTFRIEDAMSVEYYEYEDVAYAMKEVFGQMAARTTVNVPAPKVIDGYERDRLNREVRIRRDMQRQRMADYERYHLGGPQGGPPPHGGPAPHHDSHYNSNHGPQGGPPPKKYY